MPNLYRVVVEVGLPHLLAYLADVFMERGTTLVPAGALKRGLYCPHEPAMNDRLWLLGQSLGEEVVKFLRQTLGLYAKCTMKFKRDLLEQWFEKAAVRLQEEVDLPDKVQARLAWFGASVFQDDLDQVLHSGTGLVGFGPGATSELNRQALPFKNLLYGRWNDLIDMGIPASYFRLPFEADENWVIRAPRWESNQWSKCMAVPKDFRGPRLIAAEPLARSFVERAVDKWLRVHIMDTLPSVVDFEHQEKNQEAAREGSLTGNLCTLDLADASDTVRFAHVKALFGRLPRSLAWLLALATPLVRIGDRLVKPTTFCTMGNFVCFPLETLVYAGIIICSLWEEVMGPRAIIRTTVRECADKLRLRAYGDDLVIARPYAKLAMEALTQAGMRVNAAKCCIRGFFRESCGVDCIHGRDVTPLRPRELPGSSEGSFAGSLAIIQNFLDRGYLVGAQQVYDFVAQNYHVRVPVLPDGPWRRHPALLYSDALWALCQEQAHFRFNTDLQRLEVLAVMPVFRYSFESLWYSRYWSFLAGQRDDTDGFLANCHPLEQEANRSERFRGYPVVTRAGLVYKLKQRWVGIDLIARPRLLSPPSRR
jgi:hypothetical protein